MSNVVGDIYEVTVEGQYYGHRNGMKTTGQYVAILKMDDTAKKQGFLSVARNKLLPRYLKANYPDYKRFKTHFITGVRNLSKGGSPVGELALMNRKQIVAWIEKKRLPIKHHLYPEVSDLRQAIKFFRESPEAFKKQQDKRLANKGPELQMMSALDELNPDIDRINFSQEAEAQVYGQLPYTPTPQPQSAQSAYSFLQADPTSDDDTDDYVPDEFDKDVTEEYNPVINAYEDEDEMDDMLAGI